jgi:hypothetical protein
MAKHPKEELIAVYLIGGGTAGVAWAAFTHLPIGDRIAAVVCAGLLAFGLLLFWKAQGTR